MASVYLNRMVSAVSKESGVSKNTLEYVLPFIFDYIRREIVEGDNHFVAIDNFGMFALKEISAREYHYYRPSKGIDEWRKLPAKRTMKFVPTRNMRQEVEQGKFNPDRMSFVHHPDEPVIRGRTYFKKYASKKKEIAKGQTRIIR